jgi:hypothetical protein
MNACRTNDPADDPAMGVVVSTKPMIASACGREQLRLVAETDKQWQVHEEVGYIITMYLNGSCR